MITSRRMRCVGYVAGMGGGGSLMERDHLGDPDIDVRIILIWFFRGLGRAVME